MKNNIQLIIPMSGIGKRFIEAGYDNPKPLIIVEGKPIIQHVVEIFDNPEDIIFICNEIHLRDTDMREILLSISPKCKIFSVSNENRKGPVDAVMQVIENIQTNKEIIISYCDYGTKWNYNNFLAYINKTNPDGCIVGYTGFHPHMLGSDNYAFSRLDSNENVLEIKEKEPFTNNKMDEFASNGTYYFKNIDIVKKYFKKLIDLDISINNEYYISLAYNLLIQDNLLVNSFLIENMLQWGTPYDLEIYKSWSNYFNNISKLKEEINNPLNTTLILPMAGKGSRFSEEGYPLPKPFLDIKGKPMFIQAVDCLPKSDNNIFICLDEHVNEYNIEEIVDKNYEINNIIIINETTEGQACTCKIGMDLGNVNLENPILISACDNGVYYNSKEYLKLINDETIDIIVWSFRNNQASKVNPNAYAWLDVDSEGFIKYVSCKKFIYDNPLTTHAIIGTMFFRKGKYFIDGFEKNVNENIRTNNEFYVDDVLNQNIKDGLKVKVFEVENYICWGTPNDYKTYQYWEKYFTNKHLIK
jgi:NDP-sugar pyrophosphorylase family protein